MPSVLLRNHLRRHLRVCTSYYSPSRSFAALSSKPLLGCIHHDPSDERMKRSPISAPHHIALPHNVFIMQSRTYWRDTLASYCSLESTPIRLAHDVIVNIHDQLGIPWWAAIPLTTLLLRTTLTVPLAIYSMHIQARLVKLQPEIKALAEELKKEVAIARHRYKWDDKMCRMQFISNVSSNLSLELKVIPVTACMKNFFSDEAAGFKSLHERQLSPL